MKRIGVLGGGQLGMMLYQSLGKLELELTFLDPDPACSCIAVGAHVQSGDFKDYQTVLEFGKDKDVVTVEIEHVNIGALKKLEEQGVEVYPQADILEMIQDKGLQKEFYQNNGLPTAPFDLLRSKNDLDRSKWPLPFVLKSRKGGYDGKGVQIIRTEQDLDTAMDDSIVVEQLSDIDLELSVIVARSSRGEIKSFPLVEMEFDPEANLVSALVSPAHVSKEIESRATELAEKLIEELDLVGLLAVELFLQKDGSIWINEVAPRPHNSGHQTIEGNLTSQYEQHLRAIAGMSLGKTDANGVAVMVNLLGKEGFNGPKKISGEELVDGHSNAFLHDYYKALTRPKRKMGHVTVVSQDRDSAMELALDLQEKVQYTSESK